MKIQITSMYSHPPSHPNENIFYPQLYTKDHHPKQSRRSRSFSIISTIMYKNRLLCIITNYVNEPWHIYIHEWSNVAQGKCNKNCGHTLSRALQTHSQHSAALPFFAKSVIHRESNNLFVSHTTSKNILTPPQVTSPKVRRFLVAKWEGLPKYGIMEIFHDFCH